MLNLCRGNVKALGNTSGLLRHWSRRIFVGLLDDHFEVLAVATPVPWIVALCRTKERQAQILRE